MASACMQGVKQMARNSKIEPSLENRWGNGRHEVSFHPSEKGKESFSSLLGGGNVTDKDRSMVSLKL